MTHESGEVWVRVPRELFDDTRRVLQDATTDLHSASKRDPHDVWSVETAIRCRLVRDELNLMGRGMLIESEGES